jgi:hypothetical protein
MRILTIANQASATAIVSVGQFYAAIAYGAAPKRTKAAGGGTNFFVNDEIVSAKEAAVAVAVAYNFDFRSNLAVTSD